MFFEMPGSGLVDTARLDVPEAQLHGLIPVCLIRFALNDRTGARLNYRYRHDLTVIVKDLRHA